MPRSKKIKFHRYADIGRTQETLACSQTLYFLFKGCRARMMKYKPHAHSRTPALLASSPMFSKRTKRKIKQCLCTGYRDFRHRRTMILKVYINGHENEQNHGKELNNVWMNFSPTYRQKPERQCSTTIHCQHNSIFHMQKKKIVVLVVLTGKNGCLSGLKNIWPVIMTSDLLFVILSLDTDCLF